MLLEQQERRGNLQQTEFTFYIFEEWVSKILYSKGLFAVSLHGRREKGKKVSPCPCKKRGHGLQKGLDKLVLVK